METNSQHYIDLITRYFYGEATPGEIVELEAWVKSEPANAEVFSGYQKTWKALQDTKTGSSINLDHEWNTLLSKLPAGEIEILHPGNNPQAPKSKIVNRKSKILSWSLRIAAAFLLLAIPSYLLYRQFISPAEISLAASGNLTRQALPDGTIVTLNQGATLSYPAHFEGSFRKVTLNGEAWFEVAHDKTKPFIVAAENVRIRVVGTSFLVNTRTCKDTKEIILASGMVDVYYEDKPGKKTMLSPGEKAELSGRGYEISKTTNRDVNYLAWKTKHIAFTNTPLNEVVAVLSKVYHTDIRFSPDSLSDCRITTTFDRQSLESVLNVLKATLDLQIRNTGNGIELSGHGCSQHK
ncbi:MAG: DUF4974 domain-containing protein [Bacteroidetes bacterium]|nr:DUF4974 domain-containing protein [Bacteroidota bacterium]